jgi:predicted DCC family thiol-disulfide oxidoreductase YuxK
MKNSWTGGQYSLARLILGTYLFAHFAYLTPWARELFSDSGVLPDGSASPLLHLFPNILALWDGPVFVTALLIAAAGLSVLFALGCYDRVAAVALWYIWACLHGRMPLIINPGLPYVGWLLLMHAFLPSGPYGSWSARSRIDPGNNWRMPAEIFLVAWVLMALGYTYSGYTKLVSPSWLDGTAVARVLNNPLARPGFARDALLALPDNVLRLFTWAMLTLELGFAPLALFRRLRPWLWLTMLMMHVCLILVIDFADLSLGMVMLHVFTCDPGWIRCPKTVGQERILYDGDCGFCHGFVRFVLAEDRGDNPFHFAPLNAEAFRLARYDAAGGSVPNSIVVVTADGTILTRSSAVLHTMKCLGGFWRGLAMIGHVVPVRIRDGFYDGIAGFRRRILRAPLHAFPLVPIDLRGRFEI